ncbi:MAG: SusC/RagA family TonB-linked outer membrane protein, partial [Pedobacter sp.]|nr:SusC/RagA family TonB-linked outer membrane protein [Pedobacter sp.]
MKTIYYSMVFSILMICLVGQKAKAQNRVINGKVVDQTNSPLLGASVKAKGLNTATVTNAEGQFTITVPSATTKLIVSFLGMKPVEVDVTNKTTVNVKLISSNSDLNDVIVIGYGTQKKGDINSSISSISAKDIAEIPQVSVDQLLQGKAPGVYVSQNSGAPGSNTSVQIRGVTSLSGANDPLYVIDGVAISGDPNNKSTSGRSAVLNNKGEIGSGNGESTVSPLSTLNPNDIESIQILKDASATAIYGSRGSNGVIIITTKRGKDGKGVINYEGYYGIRQQNRFLDMMNLKQYAVYQNALADAFGSQRRPEFANPQFLSDGTNWQREVFKTAGQQNHQVSLSGAKDGTDYYLSGNYTDQEGTILGSNYNRYSFRTNVNGQVRDWFKTGISVAGSRSFERRGISDNGGIVTGALLSSPDRA